MYKKILCVDDDPITLMLCKKVIQKSEFSETIEIGHNGEDALKYLDSFIQDSVISNGDLPELLFLDLNMPVMGGWEFLDIITERRYNEIFPQLKVIVLSSTIDPKDIEKSKSYPMVLNFLSKPITREMLEDLKQNT
ncbi:response regulator [Flavobacterium sp.]|uniref:response regulator n=1 Tax=Flavobacterium sp. TaxID=239 RepID=UPI00261BAFEA|nr:response regulator [Flavobacterium sp.]